MDEKSRLFYSKCGDAKHLMHEAKESDRLSGLVDTDHDERKEYAQYVANRHNGNFQQGAKAWAAEKGRESDDIFGEREKVDQYIKHFLSKQSSIVKKFGKSDWDNLFLIAQHSDHNVPFQELALKYLNKYSTPSNQKYLTDRILRNKHKLQKHGTQNLPWRGRTTTKQVQITGTSASFAASVAK